MAKANTATVEAVDDRQQREIEEAESRLREAEAAQRASNALASDRGEKISDVLWKRLPLLEGDAAALRSDASWQVKQARWAVAKAKRPRLPLAAAQAALARAQAHRDACGARLTEFMAERHEGDAALDRAAVHRAGRREREIVDAVLEADLALEVAQACVRDAEGREVAQRAPLFELNAVALARQIDGLLDALVAIVRDQVALDEQARVAGCPMDAGIFVGALPEGVAYWRARNAGRLVRENAE